MNRVSKMQKLLNKIFSSKTSKWHFFLLAAILIYISSLILQHKHYGLLGLIVFGAGIFSMRLFFSMMKEHIDYQQYAAELHASLPSNWLFSLNGGVLYIKRDDGYIIRVAKNIHPGHDAYDLLWKDPLAVRLMAFNLINTVHASKSTSIQSVRNIAFGNHETSVPEFTGTAGELIQYIANL